ncbi:MAG TPA: CHAT domain-containing tetratricopeptide repeat protein [Pyrinomonadaceae bacterium]|jgi:CHAT domain-containing protein/tetratricopeptide (TPR) repeat protein
MKFKASPLAFLLSCAVVLTSFNLATLNAQVAQPRGPISALASEPQAEQAKAALEQGRRLLKRGQADQALGQLEQALTLYQQANDPKGTAIASDALGDLYSRQGQYEVALKHYQEARTAYSSANDTYNANLMLAKTGDMYYRSGNINEARSAYSQMSVPKPDLNAAKDVQQKASKGRGLFSRAQSIASGGPSLSTASSAASVGTDVANTVKEERDKYRQFILYAIYETGIGRADYLSGQLDSAKTHFDNALAAADSPLYGKFGQSRRWRVAARTSLGDVALGQNRYADAIKLYTAAADGARKDNRPDLIWPAQRGMGRSLWAQAAAQSDQKKAAKNREESIASYRNALKTIETIRQGSLSADESRSTFLGTTKDVYDEAASALAERALMAAASASAPLSGAALTDAAEAFQIVEQSRARSLLDMLGESGTNITEGVPADLLKRKQDNLDRQQEIAEIMTGNSLNPDADKKSNADLEAELNQLSTEYDSIENQIRAASPRYASLTLPQPLSLAEVQQQVLDDKTTLLEYSLGNQNSYLWAVTQGGVSLFKLPARTAVDQQAIDLRNQLVPTRLRTRIAGIDVAANQTRGLGVAPAGGADASAVSAFATASNALYKTAVEPAASLIADKRLLVIADGALNYVPFEALVTASGGADYAALPYLVKTNEIVYAPSASVVSVIRKQSVKPTGKNVLLVADPVFNSNDPRAKGAAGAPAGTADTRGLGLASALTDVAGTPANQTPATGLQLARLTGTRTEADEIAKLTRTSGGTADVWLDLQANEASVQTKDLKNYRVLHIATHGLLDAERPQFTGLVLSLVGNKTGDGFLRTDEIFNLKLGAPLVMLSACETGLGKEKRGEGVIGLTRAFMYAGAPTVGVSLWSVADRSTADLMTDLYKRMLTGQGMSAVAAKRAAQQSMIDGKKYSAPFYWAPFVLVGEWR